MRVANRLRFKAERAARKEQMLTSGSSAAEQAALARTQQQSSGIAQIATAMRDLDKGVEETIDRIRALEHSAKRVADTVTRISGVAAEFRP